MKLIKMLFKVNWGSLSQLEIYLETAPLVSSSVYRMGIPGHIDLPAHDTLSLIMSTSWSPLLNSVPLAVWQQVTFSPPLMEHYKSWFPLQGNTLETPTPNVSFTAFDLINSWKDPLSPCTSPACTFQSCSSLRFPRASLGLGFPKQMMEHPHCSMLEKKRWSVSQKVESPRQPDLSESGSLGQHLKSFQHISTAK